MYYIKNKISIKGTYINQRYYVIQGFVIDFGCVVVGSETDELGVGKNEDQDVGAWRLRLEGQFF